MERRPIAVMLKPKEADLLRSVVAHLEPDDEIVCLVVGNPRKDQAIINDILSAMHGVYARHGRPLFVYKARLSE